MDPDQIRFKIVLVKNKQLKVWNQIYMFQQCTTEEASVALGSERKEEKKKLLQKYPGRDTVLSTVFKKINTNSVPL